MLEIFPDFAVAGVRLETSLKCWSLQQNARNLATMVLTEYVITRLYLELPSYQGIQGKLGNFIFNQGKSGGKERHFEKSGKVREVIELLLFHLEGPLALYSVAHPIECDNRQVFPLC